MTTPTDADYEARARRVTEYVVPPRLDDDGFDHNAAKRQGLIDRIVREIRLAVEEATTAPRAQLSDDKVRAQQVVTRLGPVVRYGRGNAAVDAIAAAIAEAREQATWQHEYAPDPERCVGCGGLCEAPGHSVHWHQRAEKAEARIRRLEAALTLPLDFYGLDTPAFVAKYGHGYTTKMLGDHIRAALTDAGEGE